MKLKTTTLLSIAFAVCGARAADVVTFEQHVKPIFRQHCAGCHSQDGASSDLAVDGYDGVLAGGASGPVLASGDPGASRLWRMVTHAERPFMPPGGEKLPDAELAVLRNWIAGGLVRDQGSKPLPMKRSAIAAVEPSQVGKPVGELAMPKGLFRQPVVTGETVGPIATLAASPWAPLIATPWQRQVSLYHAETLELLGVLPYLEGTPRVVRFSRDGSLLLVAGGQDASLGAAALYDVVSGARVATLGDELDIVLAADVSPDNSLVAIGGPKKKVRVYRTADGELAYVCEKHTDWITAIAFSPNGKLLATADRASGLRLWEATSGYERADLRGHKGRVTSVEWRPDSQVLASASEDDSVRLWQPTGKSIKSFRAHGGGTMSVSFAGDGRMVTTGRDRRIKLWKPSGDAISELARVNDIALAAVFARDGNQVVAADWTGVVGVFDVASKKTVGRITPNPPTLERRVADAERQWAEAESAHDKALAAAEATSRRLASAVEKHAAHDGKLADARLAVADASVALSAGITELASAEDTVQSTREALDKAEAAVAKSAAHDTEANTDNGEPSETESVLAALVAARDAARAKAESAIKQRDEARHAMPSLQLTLSKSEATLAKLTSQSTGLPDLEQLESDLATHQERVAVLKQSLQSANGRRQRSADELAAYLSATERLAGELAAATQRRDELQTAASQAAAERQEAEAASANLQREVAGVQRQVDKLNQQLRELQSKARKASGRRQNAQNRSTNTGRALKEAERQARLAEAKLDDLRATQAWRGQNRKNAE